MTRNDYFESMKRLAREKRQLHRVETSALGLAAIRQIYKLESIKIDQWKLPSKVKAVYMCDCNDCSVAIQRSLPDEPKIFALVHELKHHYCDREAIGTGAIHCGEYDANELIEKGAEVFAAEFIYPEASFANDVDGRKIQTWHAEDVVLFKRECGAKVSYRFICKRLEWLRLIRPNQFDCVQFRKLEEEMFGVPFYRRRRA